MKRNKYAVLFLVAIVLSCSQNKAKKEVSVIKPETWKASWIAPVDQTDTINAWTVFRKEVHLDQSPPDTLMAQIAADSKYWLWVNGELILREGGLKRGPTPTDTYYDKVPIFNLKEGNNSIAVLVNYFGKEGFSHKSSGQNGLMFNLVDSGFEIVSDTTWKAWPHPAFGETSAPYPNFRLPESNLFFDASQGDFSFADQKINDENYPNAIVVAQPNEGVFGELVQRPIPQWKDFGLKPYSNSLDFPLVSKGDTIKLDLPYNAQVSPYFKIKAEAGDTLDIRTDHYYGGGPPNVRAQYVTKKGIQEFEILGWINGHEVHYFIPEGIEVLDLKFRETGYNTEFSGSFTCDDPFFNQLWQKALRTLYVTIRDTYMDCPDRERAQWWGDVVLESGESFYALDRKADALTQKGILELMNWQRQDKSIFSPVPAGNWDKELPGQMLASVGYYGVYNYYLHTGDLETIKNVYQPIKDYLSLWELQDDGTVSVRQGGWIWGDWGQNKDIPLLMNTQYHLAQKGLLKMAEALGKSRQADSIQTQMNQFKSAFNSAFWQGDHYRSKNYKGETDDRSQGLAVVAGLADPDQYNAIVNILQTEMHASPYMEKYVCEALFQMNEPELALKRLKKRFNKMVNHPELTTLWEGWGIGKEGFGGGTTNHAWSGGGLTLLSQYVAGIAPTSPGYKTFKIDPQLGDLTEVSARVPSINGMIEVNIRKSDTLQIDVVVPEETSAEVVIPQGYSQLSVAENGTVKELNNQQTSIQLDAGSYTLIAK